MLVCLVIVVGAGLIAWMSAAAPLLRDVIQRGDNVFYDAFYHLRPLDDRTNGPVVIVAVDDRSLQAVDKAFSYGWPWPREFWGHMVEYLDKCGARAVAFDLVFSQTSVYQNSTGDDDAFAKLVGAVKVPVVFGSLVNADGSWDHFAPPVAKPTFGAVNVGKDVIYRQYDPQVYGRPSLAVAAANAAGQPPKLAPSAPFLLHYYGPYATADGHHTHRFISAAAVLGAALQGDAAAKAAGISPDWFRGKIVLIGTITLGTFDLKSSPLSAEYPGVEIQATAMENLIAGQRVRAVTPLFHMLLTLAATALTTIAVVFPRRVMAKILGPILAVAMVLGFGSWLFMRPEIRWLSSTGPLLAVAVATVAAFGWTYFAEDRQRRFMLKALSKVVSPAVAQQLAREPQRLALGTIRTRITLLFTDLANFTDMSEAMDVEKLGQLLNRYLGEMSDQVLLHQGTLDKYIGDAIMCFWGAPLPQEDHATRACRTALAIAVRESAIREELRQLGADKIFTRIGINTTDAAVGFVGSSHLFNYTALGDGVNLASRLEGANKIYGTRIMISQPTAELVRDRFILRKLDVLRVKGKRQPMAVYELLAERGALPADGQLQSLVSGYERAFSLYQHRQWDPAQKELLELEGRFADDGAIKALLRRIATLRNDPPPDDWDGVYVAKEK